MNKRQIKKIFITILQYDKKIAFIQMIGSDFPHLVVKSPQNKMLNGYMYDLDLIITGQNGSPINGFDSYRINCWLMLNFSPDDYVFAQYDFDNKKIELNEEDRGVKKNGK